MVAFLPSLLLLPALASPTPGAAEADALAGRLVASTGDPYTLEALQFTFVVRAGGEEKVRRSYRWCPKQGRVAVTLPEGSAQISAVDGHPLRDTPAPLAEAAWRAFTNDAYWLLAPAKVLDPGVRRSVDDAGHLVLTFDGVGLTPGDRYVLTVDPDDGHLVHWDFVLQSGREGSFDWAPPVEVGGLHLSALRTAGDGTTTIAFEDLDAPASCPLPP